MTIIGITGTSGAGKGTVVKYLTKNYGFIHFSVSDFLKKEIVKRKLPVNRQNMVGVANDLRKKHGGSFMVDELFEKTKGQKKDVVIESLRTPTEIESLNRNKGFILFAVRANKIIRYKRIVKRKSKKDNVTFKEFVESEKKEMISKDPTKQNLAKCIQMADMFLLTAVQ